MYANAPPLVSSMHSTRCAARCSRHGNCMQLTEGDMLQQPPTCRGVVWPRDYRRTAALNSMMGNCSATRRRRRLLTVAVFGIDNVGKTSLIKCLQGDSLDSVVPTVGFASYQIKAANLKITIYDLGGGFKIRDIWKNYLAEIHGLVYVIDASDHRRTEETRAQLHKLVENPRVQRKPILLLLNKQDLDGAMDEVEATEQFALEQLVNANRCPCRIETCSAMAGTGKRADPALRAGWHWLLAQISQLWPLLQPRVKEDSRAQAELLKSERMQRLERIRRNSQQNRAELQETELDQASAAGASLASKGSANGMQAAIKRSALDSPDRTIASMEAKVSCHSLVMEQSPPASPRLASQTPKLPPISEAGAALVNMAQPRPVLPSGPTTRKSSKSAESVTGLSVTNILSQLPPISPQPLRQVFAAAPPPGVSNGGVELRRSVDAGQRSQPAAALRSSSMDAAVVEGQRRRRRKRLRRSNKTRPDDANDSDDDSLPRTEQLGQLRTSEPRPSTPGEPSWSR